MDSQLDDTKVLEIMKRFSYDCCFVQDSNGTITFMSDSYKRITGNDPSELIGKNCSILEKQGIVETSIAEQVQRDKRPTTMSVNYNNGKDIIVTAIPVFDKEENLIAIIGNIRDMTELNSLKKKLAHNERKVHQDKILLEELKMHVLPNKEFISSSPQMKALASLAIRISKVNSTVLITGESGVGKDVLTQYIHKLSDASSDKQLPYMKVSCGAIPETLLESELFGYEFGAFTGAKKGGKPGILEVAGEGIVFLDEIGELTLPLQVKLLTVIQDRQFTRLGGVKPIQMNARIIAATNRDLEQAVAAGEFREDLYYRLNVIPVNIPPLRERKEDIIPLIHLYVDRFNEKYKLHKSIEPAAIQLMESYSWPGNVRELSNVIERLMVLSSSDTITQKDLPLAINNIETISFENTLSKDIPLQEFMDQMEHLRVLTAVNKDQSLKEAANELGIDISTLTRKIQKYGIARRNKRKYVHNEMPKSQF